MHLHQLTTKPLVKPFVRRLATARNQPLPEHLEILDRVKHRRARWYRHFNKLAVVVFLELLLWVARTTFDGLRSWRSGRQLPWKFAHGSWLPRARLRRNHQ